MSCIKTGCYLFLEPYNLWAYGDAHMDTFEEVYIFRICQIETRPIGPKLHFTVRDWDYFFDGELVPKKNATMICPNIKVTNHGYDGVEVPR